MKEKYKGLLKKELRSLIVVGFLVISLATIASVTNNPLKTLALNSYARVSPDATANKIERQALREGGDRWTVAATATKPAHQCAGSECSGIAFGNITSEAAVKSELLQQLTVAQPAGVTSPAPGGPLAPGVSATLPQQGLITGGLSSLLDQGTTVKSSQVTGLTNQATIFHDSLSLDKLKTVDAQAYSDALSTLVKQAKAGSKEALQLLNGYDPSSYNNIISKPGTTTGGITSTLDNSITPSLNQSISGFGNILQNQPSTTQVLSGDLNTLAKTTAAAKPTFGLPQALYDQVYADGKITEAEKLLLYNNYYTPSPASFAGSATNYGDPGVAVATLDTYGSYIRQEMQRGWVLEASGMYGVHNELSSQLQNFHFTYSNSSLNHSNVVLQDQKSPLYAFFADQHKDANGQPVPVTYDQLNSNQKRIYDLTSISQSNFTKNYLVPISQQSQMTPQDALKSGKYVGIVATKSVNDLGKQLLLYKNDSQGSTNFVGVAIVGDYAKRGDWVGSGAVTNKYFTSYPLGTRVQKGEQWGFDLTQDLYKYYGGAGGPAYGVVAVDPNAAH